MADLANEQCETMSASSILPAPDEVAAMKAQLPEWTLVNDGMNKLERVFTFKTFAQSLAFSNAVAAEAEAQGHHPKLTTEWGRATVVWWTHFLGGLHKNDFIMAARTDAIAAQQTSATVTARDNPLRDSWRRPRETCRLLPRRPRLAVPDLARPPALLAPSRPGPIKGWASTVPSCTATSRRASSTPPSWAPSTPALAAVAANGGKLVSGPNEIPGIGTHAYCEDPEGNLFGIIQEPQPD